MTTDQTTQEALKLGLNQATAVLEFREKALETRARVLKNRKTTIESQPTATVEEGMVSAIGGSASAGVLVAEGDSWFDYPWNDVLRLLEDRHGYDVESVAHKGDRVEEMSYSGGQLEEFTRSIEKLLRRSIIPKAILLSGGGNDIAGKEFGMLLNHANSATPGLNDQVLAGVIDERIRFAYVTILSAVTRVSEVRLAQRTRILLHGYDYPVPDGRGFWGGWWLLPGPWLEPGFREKGYSRMAEKTRLAKVLIDRFNEMLQQIATLPQFSHVTYVDLRNTLSTGADYKKWWDNELHPTALGFGRVASRIASSI